MPSYSQRGPSPADLNPDEHVPDLPPQVGGQSDYLKGWAARHAQAETVDARIRSLAFPGVGEDPGVIETMAGEDPAAIGMSVPGGLGPHHMLTGEQTLRKWEVPPLPPSHHPGFGTSTAANYAAGTISQNPKEPHLDKEVRKLAERMAPGGHPDPLGQVVANRKVMINESLVSGNPDAAWYQGKAQALIYHHAMEHDVPVPTMRKTTAGESPRSKWDMTYKDTRANRKAGLANQTIFPNVTDAGRIIEAAKGRSPEAAANEVVARKIPGVQRQSAARIAASMMEGTLQGHHLLPLVGEAEKMRSFDVNLSDPTHPVYGHSAWVQRHQLSAHTPDVQDARAGGYHEDQLEVPRPPRIDPETGEQAFDYKGNFGKKQLLWVGKPHHEEMLARSAGADIAQSTATVARTEEFTSQEATHGTEWARQNAINFMPGPSQSMQWSVARETGTVDIPEHVQAAYDARPKPTGFGGYKGPGTQMTKRDWSEM